MIKHTQNIGLTVIRSVSILLALLLTSCISDSGETPNLEGERLEDSDGGSVNVRDEGGAEEGEAGDTAGAEETAGVSTMGGAQPPLAGTDGPLTPDAGTDTPSVTPEPDPPPPSTELSACDRFCERVSGCLYPDCPALSGVSPDDFCRGWCGRDARDWLNESAELACDDFNQRIYGFSPEVRALCSESDGDPCGEICEFGEICGLVSDECSQNCGALNFDERLCFAAATELGDCQRYIRCLNGGGGRGDGGRDGGLEEACGAICEREASCIFNACALGTVTADYTDDCETTCVSETQSGAELMSRFRDSCDEIVTRVRESSPTVDERCEQDEEGSCEILCGDRVSECLSIEQADCVETCGSWDRAQHICLAEAGECSDVQGCFIDPDAADRCRRSCDYLQLCLEEACPPRIIPPQLTDGCTADCFEDPPSVEEIEEWEASTCREVREVVYRDNRQLRPICEGSQDFRASPEECSAFCDGDLGECIIGGRSFCLAACSSLDRDQYQCALEAQSDCELIDTCLADSTTD
jgi:hypothetical protein